MQQSGNGLQRARGNGSTWTVTCIASTELTYAAETISFAGIWHMLPMSGQGISRLLTSKQIFSPSRSQSNQSIRVSHPLASVCRCLHTLACSRP